MEKPLIPTFSHQEMLRRWDCVRRIMKQRGFDALICLPNQGHWDQFGADTRYLTQIGGFQTEAAAVFPLEEEPTAIVRGANEVEWWSAAQQSVRDIRISRRSYSGPVMERLREVRAAKVGVVALEGLVRAPEGVVPWGTYQRIREGLPAVAFTDATEILQEARSVKSAEEIGFLSRAAKIIGTAIDAMIQKAAPGVPENCLIAEMLKVMVDEGSEPMTMLLFGAGGPEVPWAQRVITRRPLKSGDLINTEVEAKYGGYIAQALQPLVLGPKPEPLEKIYDATKNIFDKLLKILKPGVTFGEIAACYQDEVRAAGYEPGGALLHGRGLGEDAPMLWGAVKEFPEAQQRIKEGHVFILKPAALKGKMRDSIRAGDTVVVEARGARRLGTRPLTLLSI